MRLSGILVGLLGAAGVLSAGCSSPAEDPAPSSTASRHAEVVVASFYKAGQRTSVCSGTLIAPRVVLTAAHCAHDSDGARITAPNFRGKTSTVVQVKTFDWLLDRANSPSDTGDLALLILRSPIQLPRFPKIQLAPCAGCSVLHVSHAYGAKAASSGLRVSSTMRASSKPPAGREAQLFFPKGSADSGGPLFHPSTSGNVLVGLLVGQGKQSGGGYAAQLSAPSLQDWLRKTVLATAAKTSTSAGYKTQDEEIPPDDQAPAEEAPAEEAAPEEAPSEPPPEVPDDPGSDTIDPETTPAADTPEQPTQENPAADEPFAPENPSPGEETPDPQPSDDTPTAPAGEDVDPGYSSEPDSSDPTKPDPTNPDPTDPDPTNPDPTKPDPNNPDPNNPDPTDPNKADPSKADASDPVEKAGFDEGVTPVAGYAKDSVAANNLKAAANSGMAGNEGNCSGSVAKTMTKMGNTELNGKVANDQVDYMEKNWKTVSAQEAQDLANAGQPVVAGLANPNGHGHVAVVVPGDGAIKPDKNFYPNVQGGSLGGAGKSWGDKTSGDVWNTSDRKKVKYYVPNGTSI